MNVVEFTNEVTPEYIRGSLQYQYGSRSWSYSDRLCKVLANDAKNKANNLHWLFEGKSRIRLSLTAEDVYKDLIKENTVAQDLRDVLLAMGAQVEAKDFIKGMAVYQKNTVRVNKILEDAQMHITELPPEIVSRYGTRQFLGTTSSKYKEFVNLDINLANSQAFGSINIFRGAVIPTADIKQTLKPSFFEYLSADNITSLTSSQDVILSLDVNDYVTCSTQSGATRSCLRIDGEYHLGWMQHFRSDFSIIMFTHSKKNEFEKTGRAFIQVRLTEDGVPYIKPYYKVGKTYGTINATHRRLVNELIQQKAEVFGLGEPEVYTTGDFNSSMVSPNIAGGPSNGDISGYFDRYIDKDAAFYVYKSDIPAFPNTSNNYRYGPSCIMPFPDALDVNGHITDVRNFGNPARGRSSIGFNHETKFVTCSKTGEEVPLGEAALISFGNYVSNKWLLEQTGLIQESSNIVHNSVQVEQSNLDEIDVDDF